jgi:hypothetical protein
LRGLEELLGPSWLRRQHAAFDGLPMELLDSPSTLLRCRSF